MSPPPVRTANNDVDASTPIATGRRTTNININPTVPVGDPTATVVKSGSNIPPVSDASNYIPPGQQQQQQQQQQVPLGGRGSGSSAGLRGSGLLSSGVPQGSQQHSGSLVGLRESGTSSASNIPLGSCGAGSGGAGRRPAGGAAGPFAHQSIFGNAWQPSNVSAPPEPKNGINILVVSNVAAQNLPYCTGGQPTKNFTNGLVDPPSAVQQNPNMSRAVGVPAKHRGTTKNV